MEGIDGENPGKIRFPRVNLFKCESWSSACPRCPSQQGGHPSHNPVVDSHRWICNFSLSASCSRDSSEPSVEPTWHNIPSLSSHGFICLIPRLRDALCHPSQDALRTQTPPRFPKCFGSLLFQLAFCSFTSTHRPESTRGCEGPVWFLITASVAVNRDDCLGLSHLIAMFVLEDMIQLLQDVLHLVFSMGFGK